MANLGNDFVPQMALKTFLCSECNGTIQKGSTCLVSVRKGKVQKRVCGEECRRDFDYRFWSQRARDRSSE